MALRGWGYFLLLPAAAALLPACAPSEDGTAETDGVGVLLDAPVEGVDYAGTDAEGNAFSGTTNADGEFEYVTGQEVRFSIGDIELGTLEGQAVITPVDLVSGALNPVETEVQNRLRFLQSVDDDGDPSNGITVPEAVREAAMGASIDFAVASDLTDFLDPLGITLLAGATALGNFTDALAARFDYPFDPDTGLSPAQGESTVAFSCGPSPVATFDVAMDPGTFTSDTVRVFLTSVDIGTPVDLSISYTSGAEELELGYSHLSGHTAVVVLGTGIQQADGTPMPAPFYWYWNDIVACF